MGGNTPSTKDADYWDGKCAFATPKDLSNLNAPLLLATERHLTEAGVNRVSSGLLPSGTVLMSSRAPIGYVAISSIPVCVNQGFAAMVCRRSIGPIYAYFWTLFSMDEIKSRASGSTFPEISKGAFREIKFVRPPRLLSDTFEKWAAPLFDRISINLHNSRALSQTRDLLLPKLMSGEISIKDAEKHVGEAGA
jgi:type I restriction enzyme S subunit